MLPRIRLLLTSSLMLLMLSTTGGGASAATAVNVVGGPFTGATTTRQTLRSFVLGIPVTVTCTQTFEFGLLNGSFSGAGLRDIGDVTSMAFTCDNGATARVLNPAYDIGGDLSRVTGSGRGGTALFLVLGVNVSVIFAGQTCLFKGDIGLSVRDGSNVGTLLGVTLRRIIGPCTADGTVSSVSYSFNRAVAFTVLP